MTIWPNPWDINPLFRRKLGNEAKTVDANENDTELYLPVNAGEYLFDINLNFLTGMAIKCDLTPSAGTISGLSQALKNDGTTATLVHEIIGPGAQAVTNIGGVASPFRWWGNITLTLDCTLNFRWSRQANSGTSTIGARSHLALVRVN